MTPLVKKGHIVILPAFGQDYDFDLFGDPYGSAERTGLLLWPVLQIDGEILQPAWLDAESTERLVQCAKHTLLLEEAVAIAHAGPTAHIAAVGIGQRETKDAQKGSVHRILVPDLGGFEHFFKRPHQRTVVDSANEQAGIDVCRKSQGA